MIETLAATAISWTPATFYVASGIVNTIVVLVAFRVLQIDVEHNSFVGAGLAAAVFTAFAYFFRDAGVIGVMVTGTAVFGSLVFVSSGEALKSLGVAMLVFASFGGLGSFITARTPLTLDDIGGIPRVVLSGGLEAEPITEETTSKLSAPQ